VWKYTLPTEPLPGARSPENQIAYTTTLFLALSIDDGSVTRVAVAALVPLKRTESNVISKLVAESGKARGMVNVPKCSSLVI
jgi:hypothetical protein